MEKIKTQLERIQALSGDELDELRKLVLDLFEAHQLDTERVHSTDDFEVLEVLASAATAVKREEKRREDNVMRAHEAQDVLASFRAEPRTSMVPGVPSDRGPQGWRTGGAGSARALTASGMEITDSCGLAQEFLNVLRTYEGSTGVDGEKVRIATLRVDRGPSQTLRASDSPEAITASLEAAAEAHERRLREALAAPSDSPQAITAAGGLGGFRDTDFTLPGFESTARPVKAALPVFTTDRGGVRFMRPPALASLNGAVGIWTVQNDIDARTNAAIRKPALRDLPGGEVAVDTQAITNILVFGNLMGRAYPEFVRRVMDLAAAAHARVAEQQLLTQIGALSTAVSGAANEGEVAAVTPAVVAGATRVLLPLYERAATGMRNRLRMAPDVPLQLILPVWARGILRSDLAMQEPGDTKLGVTDAELTSYLATRHLAPTWAMDGEAGQQFDLQNPGPVNAWPTSVISYMFPAGAFQFLDNGTLDLGLVRDSTLNAANDYMLFSETFEAVAFRGGEAFRISQAVTPSGLSQAAA